MGIAPREPSRRPLLREFDGMPRRHDIVLVLPPRPEKLVESLRASRPTPCPELARVANDLGARGFTVAILNADLIGETQFREQLRRVHGSSAAIAFLSTVYRIPAACRAARALKQVPRAHRPQTIGFGYLAEDFLADPRAEDFDEVLLGPDWSPALAGALHEIGVTPGAPLAPRHVVLERFEELTGDPGLSACIEAPARGCLHRCSFCAHQIFRDYGNKWRDYVRPRPVADVVEEMALAWRHDVRSAVFLEANFLSYPDWTRAFAVAFHQSFPSIAFAIATQLTDIVRAEQDRTLDALQSAGLVGINCGLESGIDAILKRIGKDATVAEYFHGDAIARRRGLRRFYNLILGLPGETEKTLEESRSLMRRLAPDGLQVAIATPVPGTPFYRQAEAEGWLSTRDFGRYYYYGSCVLDLPGLPAEKLLAYQAAIHAEFKNRPASTVGWSEGESMI